MKTLKSYPSYKDSENPFLKMIPSTWKKSKLKKHFKITSSKRVFENDWKSEGIPFYRARDISHLNNPNYLPDIFISREHYLRNISIHGPINIGDIIVTAVGTLGEVLVIREDKKFYFKDGNIIWFKTLNNIESDYVRLLFKTPIIKEQIKYNSNTTTVGTLTIENAKNFEIPLPSIQEQQKIIDFLNQKTSEIDTLIEDKEKLIALLEEKRQAVITEAVTKGLDPDVKMKDSGVEWIGEIPEHWEISSLNLHLKESKTKNIGNKEKNVLSLSYGRIKRRNIKNNFGLLPESFETYRVVKNGDIVLRLTDLQNDKRSLRVGLVKEKGIITSAYLTLVPNQNILSEYASLLLHAYDLKKVFYGFGSGVRQSIGFQELKKLPILLPSKEEQNDICIYLKNFTENIDETLIQLKEQITKLKEYRQALIYEAVTGKIDVQEMGKETKQKEVSS